MNDINNSDELKQGIINNDNDNKALEILKSLANGINPLNGDLLSNNDVCNNLYITRALWRCVSNLEGKSIKPKSKERKRKIVTGQENTGKKWLQEDIDFITNHYKNKTMTVEELAIRCKRSERAITFKLIELGVVNKTDELALKYNYYKS